MRKAIIGFCFGVAGLLAFGALADSEFVFGGGATFVGGHHYAGGMGIHENTDPQTISDTTWHFVYTAGDWITGGVDGVTFEDGATDTVSDAFADAGGAPNEVTVTAAAHPFAAGDLVTITNSAAYSDFVYEIQAADANTFTIVSAFDVEAAAGQIVTRGASLTIANAGLYQAMYHTSVAPANGQDVIDFALYAGASAGIADMLNFSEYRIEMKTAGNFSTPAGCDMFTAAAGDKVSLAVKNTTGGNDVTFRYIHVMVTQQ